MPQKPLILVVGLTVFAAWGVGSASAKDEKDDQSRRSQIQQQIQQRVQSNSNQNNSTPSRPSVNPGGNLGSGALRGQLQQNQNQPRTLPQPGANSSGNPGPGNLGQGALRNLPNRGSSNNDNTPRIQPGNPNLGQPSNRQPQLPNLDRGTIRDRLPNAGAQPGLNNADSENQLRNRLKQQAEDLQKQPGRGPNLLNRDGLREQLETRKPPTSGGNLPNTGDQARDRLKAAQDQLRNRPQGDVKDRLPSGNLPNLGNRPQGDLRDRLPNQGNNLPNLGNRLPNTGDNKLPNIGDRPNLGNRPNIGDRPNLNLGNRTNLGDRPNLGDRSKLGDRQQIDLGKLGRPTTPLKVDRNGLLGNLKDSPQLKDALDPQRFKNPNEMRNAFDRLQNLPELQANLKQSNLKITDLSGAFQARIAKNDTLIQNISQTNIGKQLNLNQQFNLAVQGDVARQLNLNQVVVNAGGWNKRPYIGPVNAGYTQAAFSSWYAGPGFYPAYCWMPTWSPWVSWTHWNYCLPIYDPRPYFCRPIYWYDPCPPIVVYNYPAWQPLPIVTCGTWVDVPPVVIDTGFDVQLLAVRFVDPGHKEQDLGPRYRVWLRNNSRGAIGAPFNVTLVAANGTELTGEYQQAGLTVPNMDEGAVVPVDIRLPFESNRMNLQPDGYRTPFNFLHVLVDSHRDLQENDEENNGAVIARQDILSVDPAAFSTDVTAAAPNSVVSLAGEGFGPEPGQLIIVADGQQFQAEIFGWYDLGVNFKVPNFVVSNTTPVELLVVRGDGAASNPVTISIAPEQMLGAAPLPPTPTP